MSYVDRDTNARGVYLVDPATGAGYVASGGGGGGGGAVTIADGADVAEGATTATPYSDSTGAASGTVVGLLKGLFVGVGIRLKALATPATYSDGAASALFTDLSGLLRVRAAAHSSTSSRGITRGSSVSFDVPADGSTSVAVRPLSTLGYLDNGASLDAASKPNIFKRVASSATGGNPDFAKASAGDVMSIWGANTQAALRYLHLYNKASAPVLGTDTPILSFPLNASAGFTLSIPNGGAYFNTGIAFAFTTDIATIPTTGAAAGDITSFAILAA